jgi:DNA-directed RNA polymerase
MDDRRLPVKVDKHVNGSAPDFIHGVDAAHMFNTGYECYAEGIDFAAVHDGYFGHAEHMGRTHRITVDEFVKLHRVPMLQKLHDEWCRIYPDIEFPPPPSVGNLDINDAARSTYLFG